MEQEQRCSLCHLDWLQMSQLTVIMRKKVARQFIQNLTMHLLQNAPSKDQIKSPGILKNVVKIKSQTVNIDPTRLFSCLLVLLERCPDLKPYFQFELTPIPTSLFINNMMRKPNKASLLNSLLGKDYQSITPSEIITTDVSVVDGGALLRETTWKQGIKFKDIVHSYKNYVKSNYGRSTIVFDGYGNNPSTKDHEHSRQLCNTSPKVKIGNEIKVPMNHAAFLSNDFHKMELIVDQVNDSRINNWQKHC